MAIDAEALWKCRPTKPISSKVPYYLFCFFLLLLVVVSIASLVETHGLLQQARNDLVVWCEAHQEKWTTKDHVLLIITQKNSTSHTQPEPGLLGGQSIPDHQDNSIPTGKTSHRPGSDRHGILVADPFQD